MPLAFPKPSVTRDRIAYKRERDSDLRAAKKAVWARDAYRCRHCQVSVTHDGPLERKGHVHHLVKRSQSKALRSVTSNLVLLCAPCHSDVEGYRLIIHGANANGVLRFEAAP